MEDFFYVSTTIEVVFEKTESERGMVARAAYFIVFEGKKRMI